MREPKSWDCILFGSSRVTLFDERTIPGYHCFNFSFSDGRPTEFSVFAQYIRKFGAPPRLVVVGVDARNLSRPKISQELPDFVRQMERPPGPLKTYLSWSALNFSLRTMLRHAPRRRYYDGELVGDILPGVPPYTPPKCYSDREYGKNFHLKYEPHYLAVKKAFPQARFVGYVAPISAWDMSMLIQDGSLDSYIEIMYTMAQHFDAFYDFTVVSPITERFDNTYDGHHYDRETNHLMSQQMFRGEPGFGLAVHEMSLAEYRRVYATALRDYVRRVQPGLVFSSDCRRRHPLR